ncbi:MAG: copper amine oxidase N-terminal domain-containing protein [Clostridiales bacterium]|jgi:hypothetical protein|nr:copper amine oxidase N-terminal domain-containing protein [Clostridiales bacterium]
MRRYAVFLFICVFLFFPNEARADGPTVSVSANTLPENAEIAVSGSIPYVNISGRSAETNAFKEKINDKIQGAARSKIDEAIKSRAKAISFYRYDFKPGGGDIINIVIYAEISSGNMARREAASVVFDKKEQKILGINDVVGANGAKLASAYVNSLRKKSPSKYVSSFSGISDGHDFFVTGNELQILFDSYALTKGNSEIEIVKIPLSAFRSFKLQLEGEDMPANNLAPLLPLRDVAENFGFSVEWKGAGQPISVSRGSFETSVTIGVNEYLKGSAVIKLESAPASHNGATYVPITFFEEVLGLSYYVDENGEATVSELVMD